MQKFNKGDHVMIAKDLGDSMSHFTSGCEAIVVGSYADQYGGKDFSSYTLYIKGGGETSWYEEHQLELIEAGRNDPLQKWKDESNVERKMKSDIDWIFSNGIDVLKNPHGSTLSALAKELGIKSLLGSSGEGFEYYINSITVLRMAIPYLESGDKNGWLEFCSDMRSKHATLETHKVGHEARPVR